MDLKYKISIIVAAVVLTAALAVGLIGCAGKITTKYDIVKQTKKDNYTLLNENYALKNQTVLIGDSIIEIFNDELLDDGSLTTKVYNRGISGDTSDRLLERLYDNALNLTPRNLVLLIGTNDLGRKISSDTILGNISAAIDKSKEAGVENIRICSLLPVNRSLNPGMVGLRSNKAIIAVNERFKDLCEQKHVTYVDLYSLLSDSEGKFDGQYTYDGLHPNAKGYVEIARELKKVLD